MATFLLLKLWDIKQKREAAISDAVAIMNTFNGLIAVTKEYQVFEDKDLIRVADIYRDAQNQLAKFFDYLPKESKDRFYGFADEVRKYEEKVSGEGGIERMKM